VQAAKAPASSLQAKVLLALVDVKLKLALVLLVTAAGLAVMVVSGNEVSIVQVKLAGVGSVLPAESVAWTWKVWLPAARAL
jgi:adenine deaminase